MNTPVIEMRNIVKCFGDFVANDGINLTVHKGEIHAILGENGAGKSTLMNQLYGMFKPTSGDILVNGKDPATMNIAQTDELTYYYNADQAAKFSANIPDGYQAYEAKAE